MCEEFGCLPAQAVEAIENDVDFLLFKILDLRAYAKAKEIYDKTPMDKRPRTSAMELVSEITMMLAQERINRLRGSSE